MTYSAEKDACTCGELLFSRTLCPVHESPEPCPDYLTCEVSGHTATPEGWFHITRVLPPANGGAS